MLFLIRTFSTRAGLLHLSGYVEGFINFECNGNESNSQECNVDPRLGRCSRIGIITQCYSCKYIVGLNICGVGIECISCSM